MPTRTVLISGAFAAETTAPLIPLGTHALRGVAAPLRRLHCVGLAPPEASAYKTTTGVPFATRP
jgi:hypothetical protein